MRKEDIFQELAGKVAEVTGVGYNDVLGNHSEECTDARYILVKALAKLGFTDTDISIHIGCTRQAVGYLRNNYKKAGKWILSSYWQIVSKWMENKYFERK